MVLQAAFCRVERPKTHQLLPTFDCRKSNPSKDLIPSLVPFGTGPKRGTWRVLDFITHDAEGCLVRVTTPEGTSTTDFDAFGLAWRSTSALGNTGDSLYDARGLVIRQFESGKGVRSAPAPG